jgi:glycine/D-amino acid oxidase-like deaminating enzyme
VLGASACKDEGMANALLAVLALADGARAAGARFLLGARVERIEPRGQGWKLLTTAGDVACRRVVIAGGSSSDSLAATVDVDLPIRRRVIQMIATEACAPFVEHLVYHVEERLTLKQVANGNVLVGGGWDAARDEVFDRPAVLRESIRGSLGLAMRLVPRLADLAVIRTWAGPNIYTVDGRPILGAVPGRPGLFAAVCNTYGFTLGPLCGQLVAAAVADKLTPEAAALLESMSPGRFAATVDTGAIDTHEAGGKNRRLP